MPRELASDSEVAKIGCMTTSPPNYTDADLEAYLDEALAADQMAEVEQTLRDNQELLERLAAINARRDSGIHSLGGIWRRHQIGVPSREELGSYLLGVLPDEHVEYIKFRLETLRCRYTIANLRDLEMQQQESNQQTSQRREKYFQSSAGYFKEDDS